MLLCFQKKPPLKYSFVQSQDKTYHELLNNLAHAVSHRLRSQVCTMRGLINLAKIDPAQGDDCPQLIDQLESCVDELDRGLTEMGNVIFCEQQNRK